MGLIINSYLENNTSLMLRGSTTNSASIDVKLKNKAWCGLNHPCRRITCTNCMTARRLYFCENGTVFIKKNQLDTWLTIRFYCKINNFNCDGYITWEALFREWEKLWKIVQRHPFHKFIRCLAIGPQCFTPNCHLIVRNNFAIKLIEASSQFLNESNCETKPITDSTQLLGYMFDQNYEKTVLMKDRPKGRRLLSASRGMPCSFPPIKKSNFKN